MRTHFIRYDCPTCLCVSLASETRAAAIRRLLRPHEVQHLVRWSPRRESSPFAERLGGWFREKRDDGTLRYVPDPPSCDRWCSPAKTLANGGGDCDDFALLAASMLAAADVAAWVVVGSVCVFGCQGHAWVEGIDDNGWFLLEPTMSQTLGFVFRDARPSRYRPIIFADQEAWVRAA